jgi:hypothetical protein
MASSSFDFSNSSTESKTSREMTSEFDSKAAYEACAPLHWDVEEWDFWAWSEDDESLTDGKDLQFLLDGELEDEDDDDDVSWEGHNSSSEEEDDDESTEEDPTAGSFLRARSSDEDINGDDDRTPTMEPTATMAPPVMMASETMAVMAAAAMTMVTSARFLQSSVVDSQAPTGGSVSVDVSHQ